MEQDPNDYLECYADSLANDDFTPDNQESNNALITQDNSADTVVPLIDQSLISADSNQSGKKPPQILRRPVMSLGAHLHEMRSRLIICISVTVLTFIPLMICYKTLWLLALRPLKTTAYLLDKPLDELVLIQGFGPTAGFMQIMTMAVYLTLGITAPIWIWQIWKFVAPGLTKREQRFMTSVILGSIIPFLLGVYVGYQLIVPVGLSFLLQFNSTLELFRDAWTIEYYVGFLIMCCFGMGLAFETPLIIMLLAWLDLIRPESLIKHWRLVTLAIFIIAGILTPPDPFTQIIMATSLLFFYWLGYFLARLAAPKRE